MSCTLSFLAFGFEGKVAVLANVWTEIGVCSDVLFQHAGLLAADAALPTYVLSPAATSHVDVLFIRLIPERERERGTDRDRGREG